MYISLFPLEAIAFHPEFTVSSISMILLSPSTDPIIAESGVTIQASNLIVVTPTSYTNQSVVYVPDVSVISDVYFQTNSQSYSVVETYSQTVTPDLTWSSTGSTTILYSIGDYAGTTAPTWVSVNSTTGSISILAPIVDSDSIFRFYINSNIGSSGIVQKVIQVTVLNWAITNWLSCKNTSSTTWDTWTAGYNLNSNLCIAQSMPSSPTQLTTNQNNSSSTANAISILSQSIFGFTGFMVFVFSVINGSSISSLWSMINQVQLFFLFLLTRAFIPIDVEKIQCKILYWLNSIIFFFRQNYKIVN